MFPVFSVNNSRSVRTYRKKSTPSSQSPASIVGSFQNPQTAVSCEEKNAYTCAYHITFHAWLLVVIFGHKGRSKAIGWHFKTRLPLCCVTQSSLRVVGTAHSTVPSNGSDRILAQFLFGNESLKRRDGLHGWYIPFAHRSLAAKRKNFKVSTVVHVTECWKLASRARINRLVL